MTATKIYRRKQRATAVAVVTLATALTISACSNKASGDDETEVVGVTDDTISLAILSDLTGPFKAVSLPQNLGAQLYWDNKNAEGDTCGRKVELVTRDHGYDPQKAVTLASELNDSVLAYQISLGSTTSLGIAPELEEKKIMAIPTSWSPGLGESPSFIIPGTYFDAEMLDAFDYMMSEGQIKPGDTVGHIYLQGDYGEPSQEGLQFAADASGVTVEPIQIEPSTTDLTAQVAALKSAGVKAIFAAVAPPHLAAIAGLSEAQGLRVPIVSHVGGFAPELLDTNAAGVLEDRVYIYSAFTAYGSDSPAAEAVRRLYDEAKPDTPPSPLVVLGYATAVMMDQALEAACDGQELTRDSLWDVFHDGFSADTAGATVPLDFSIPEKSPSDMIIVSRPTTSIPGGLEVVETDYAGPNVTAYLDK